MKLDKLYKVLYKLPQRGIYALVNEKSKCVYIVHSTVSVVKSLVHNIYELQNKTHRYKRQLGYKPGSLKFVFLEELDGGDTKANIASKYYCHVDIYKQLGYDVLVAKNFPKYRVRIDIDMFSTRVFVKLVSRSYREIVVGVFSDIVEATEFSKVYEDMVYIKPVYAANPLSIEFFKRYKHE